MAGDFTFLKGNIETIILNALYTGDKYGYEIAKEIKEKTENQYEIKQPTLYTYLKRLENQGLIHSYWGAESNGGRRRYYTLTAEGKENFIKFSAEWKYQKSVLDNLVDSENDVPSITQDQATPLFGTKTKRTRKKTFSASDIDDQELIAKKLAELNSNNTVNNVTNHDAGQTNTTVASQSAEQATVIGKETAQQTTYSNTDTSYREDNHHNSYSTNTFADSSSSTQNDSTQTTTSTSYEQYNAQPVEVKVKVVASDQDRYMTTATIQDAPLETEIKQDNFSSNQANSSSAEQQMSTSESNFVKQEQTIDVESKSYDSNNKESYSGSDNIGSQHNYQQYTEQQSSSESTNTNYNYNNAQQTQANDRFAVHQDTPEQFIHNFDQRAKEMSQKRQSDLIDDVDYQNVLRNVIGDQLDEMQNFKSSNPDERYSFTNERPVALEDIADEFAKDGIRMRIYNKTTAVYRPKKLTPLNKIYCITSWITFAIIAGIYGILLLFTYKENTLIPFVCTIAILLIVPIIFTFFCLSDPARKQVPNINFKLLLNVFIIVAIIVALFAFGINILFFNIKFINFGAVATQIGIPLILGFCPLIAVIILKACMTYYSK